MSVAEHEQARVVLTETPHSPDCIGNWDEWTRAAYTANELLEMGDCDCDREIRAMLTFANRDAVIKECAPYLVWSNEHQAWWGPNRCGYTRIIDRAGRYERAEAMSIAGTRDGGWHVRKGNPDEIAMPEQDAIDQYASITFSQQQDVSNLKEPSDG